MDYTKLYAKCNYRIVFFLYIFFVKTLIQLNKRRNMKPHVKKIFLLIALFLPFLLAFNSVLAGNVILWYDSARDLLSAWDSLAKPTLIGPTSGIPGIFYGPYWTWLLSIGIALSKDPRIATLIVATIPYVILFPLIWFHFKKYFSKTALVACWLLFFFGFGMTYATQLWNPYPAPLLTLLLIFLLITFQARAISPITALQGSIIGFILGIVINFHISFGLAVTVGVFFFLIADSVKDLLNQKRRRQLLFTKIFFIFFIGIGFVAAFTPFILFEIRHNFQQTHVLLNALSHFGAVVTLKGLNKIEILTSFFTILGKFLSLSALIGGIFLFAVLGYFILQIKKGGVLLNQMDKRIITLISCLLAGISALYFTAKNPVWIYHFIGVEIIFLILIALLATKISWVKYALMGWASIVVGYNLIHFMNDLTKTIPTTLYAQKEIVQTITQDANGSNYAVIAYEPSIYQYEYTYLFRWLAHKDVPYDPTQTPPYPNPCYLIVPTNDPEERHNFIQFRTPDKIYDTSKSWQKPYNIEIIRRIKRP